MTETDVEMTGIDMEVTAAQRKRKKEKGKMGMRCQSEVNGRRRKEVYWMGRAGRMDDGGT